MEKQAKPGEKFHKRQVEHHPGRRTMFSEHDMRKSRKLEGMAAKDSHGMACRRTPCNGGGALSQSIVRMATGVWED
jgi:hypothetical protein